jgi:hypothetical protein
VLKRDSLFPFIVRAEELTGSEEETGLAVPLGHDLFTLLVEVREGTSRPVSLLELNRLRLDGYGGHVVAIDNLANLARTRHFQAQLYRTPTNQSFILWQGSALTASCCQLPYLYKLSRKQLGADALCLSIPHRERLLLFPRGNADTRAEMRRLIEKHDGQGRARLCEEFFSLQADGISPCVDADSDT